MLQRRQTLFLLGVFILSILMLTGPLAVIPVEGGEIILRHSGAFDRSGTSLEVATWPLTFFFIFVALLSFLNIFFYKHRVRQMRICVFTIFLCLGMIGMIVFYIWYIMHNFDGKAYIFKVRIVIPPIMIILLFLAFKGIQRDELLVRSYERLR